MKALPKPWRSEAEAFRTLVYFVVTVAVIVAIVLIVEALS
jgi:heme/copper-type cytochrome/quinol oxidase subunit 2